MDNGRRTAHVSGGRIRRLALEPAVLATFVGLVLLTTLVILLGHNGLPFQRPRLAGASFAYQMVSQFVQLAFALGLIGVIYLVTRRRVVPNIVDRAPARSRAGVETVGMVAYALVAQGVGFALGKLLGLHPISLHLPGTVYGLYGTLPVSEVYLWVVYNFAVYAAVPYAYFRNRGYTNEQLNLRSNNRRQDLLLIVIVLALESAFELSTNTALFHLSATQLVLGAPLSFGIYFLGTVVPIMIFIYSILLPRYLRLTGSVAATVVLGGLSYAGMHLFDSWGVYDSFQNAVLSLSFVTLQYFGPGTVKSVLTLRTANAWVHVWAYHAFAPHVTLDTVNVVRIFGIR